MPLTRVDWPFANVAEKESFHVTACRKEYVSLMGESLNCNVLPSEGRLHQDMLLHTRSSTFLPVGERANRMTWWKRSLCPRRVRVEDERSTNLSLSQRVVEALDPCLLAWWDRQLPVFLSGVGYIQGDWVLVLLL